MEEMLEEKVFLEELVEDLSLGNMMDFLEEIVEELLLE